MKSFCPDVLPIKDIPNHQTTIKHIKNDVELIHWICTCIETYVPNKMLSVVIGPTFTNKIRLANSYVNVVFIIFTAQYL